MKKSILTLILAAADIILLVMIVVSIKSAGIGPTGISPTTVEASVAEETGTTKAAVPSSAAETLAIQPQAETSASIPETTITPETSVPEMKSDPETAAEESLPAEAESTGPNPGTENWLTPGMETEGLTEEESLRDVSAYNTHELPNIKDFKWVTMEILNGECPEEAEEIYFEESLGGWKCYIMDDATEMERLANMELGGTMEAIELHFDWYYVRRGGKGGEVVEDNAPDSVYHGFVNDAGEIEAEGPGRIRVTDIYAIGDHMYAFGTLHWPDGIVGYLFLVRP